MITFEELQKLWAPHRDLKVPPPQFITLWTDGAGREVSVSPDWGPAVPYPRVRHEKGINHGYRQLKGNVEAVSEIPEVQDWPELEAFLRTMNAESSPIETVGCEKCFFSNDVPDAPPVMLGSYVDIVFSDAALNDQPENILRLIAHLANAIESCGCWWAHVEFILQRFKILDGSKMPWGLMLRPKSYGRDEAEARKLWAVTLSKIATTIASLPREFPRANPE